MSNVVQYLDGSYLPLTETWIYTQLKQLHKYRPIIYAHFFENLKEFPPGDMGLRSIGLKGGRSLACIPYLFNRGFYKLFGFNPMCPLFMIKDRPSLIHAHFGPGGYDALRFKSLFNIPLITTFYGYDINKLPVISPAWRNKYKRLFKMGDIFLVEGNHMKKCLVRLGCPDDKIIVQRLGVNLEKIKYAPRTVGNNCEIKVLVSASFREKKGIPYALRAFGNVKKAHPELNLTLTLIGETGGSPEGNKIKKEIESIIHEYGLNQCTEMPGYQPYSAFIEALKTHHIFVHPSIHASNGDTEGGAPVSIIEASASGMPVLSTTHCDIPEVIVDNKSGFLVPEKDITALTEKLEYLVLNPRIWPEIGANGRKHVEANFSLNEQVKKLEHIYDTLLDYTG